MDSSTVFIVLTQNQIAQVCKSAQSRILIAAPAISQTIAVEIVEAKKRAVVVRIVLDCSDDVFRLGYGDVEALRILVDAGIEIGESKGLRTGVVIVDRQGWSFSPTPLSVEREPNTPLSPNAITLNLAQQDSVAQALGLHPGQATLFDDKPVAELGNAPITPTAVKSVETSLIQAPPIPFDLQRQVRVFQPYIQYVELSLEGAALRRQTVALPASLAPLARSERVQQRLHTTYQLISENSKINDKPLHDELNKIRKDFTHPIRSLSGSVMLRGKQKDLEERLAALEVKLERYKSTLREQLEKEIATSLDQLKAALLPLVRRQPPPELLRGCLGSKPTQEEAQRWLQHELERVFPSVDSTIRHIELKKTFKDVTYSSLNNPELQKELKQAFPAIQWDKPFEEYAAARSAADKAP
jgi:hypothetical protein